MLALWRHKKGCLKLIRSFFRWHIKSLSDKVSLKRVIHVRISIPKQHQMIMSSATRVKFIKTKVIFRYDTKGVSNQVPLNSDLEIKIYSSSNSSNKMGESGKNFSGLQNRAIRGLNIGAGFRDYKSRQERLKIRKTLGIWNRDKKITNLGRNFKLGQRDLKSGQGLQIGAEH